MLECSCWTFPVILRSTSFNAQLGVSSPLPRDDTIPNDDGVGGLLRGRGLGAEGMARKHRGRRVGRISLTPVFVLL